MGGAVFVMALLLGQSLDGIEGQWQIILLIGQVVLLLAVGIAAFQSAMRSR